MRDGENAVHLASLGLHVLGIDVAETAVLPAGQKAAARTAWSVTSVAPERLQTRFHTPDAPAWLAKLERI
jgi:hypothetical protein